MVLLWSKLSASRSKYIVYNTREGLLRGFTLKISRVIVRNRTTQLLYIGVRKTPLGYGSENAWLRKC